MPHSSVPASIPVLLTRRLQVPRVIASALLSALLTIAGALSSTVPAHAVVGTIDSVPAATLLLPYFEVDLGNVNGAQTSFTVLNTARTPTLAHVTLWTDYAVPSFSFDLYLGGRDAVEVDLRLLFTDGILPQTSPASSAAGSKSDPHLPIASCAASLPAPSQLAATVSTHLRAAHTGLASSVWGGQCGGAAIGDNIARGYITIDQVNQCSTAFPSDAGYFVAGGLGIAGNSNVLAGQYSQLNRTTKLSITENLIALEASSVSPVTTTYNAALPADPPDIKTAYTFYGRFVAAAADQREPLASRYVGRITNGGIFPTGTTVTVWRDFDRASGQAALPFACNAPPAAMPSRETVFFDEQERAYFAGGAQGVADSRPLPGFEPNVFPRAAQRVHTSTLNAQPFGWARIDLNNEAAPTFFEGARQGHVSFQRLSNGQFGGSINGHQDFNVSDWALRAGQSGAHQLPGVIN